MRNWRSAVLVAVVAAVVGCGSDSGGAANGDPSEVGGFGVKVGSRTGGADMGTGGMLTDGTGGYLGCPDDDGDGICNDVDGCPAGPTVDDDQNGYIDACDQVLWATGFSTPVPLCDSCTESIQILLSTKEKLLYELRDNVQVGRSWSYTEDLSEAELNTAGEAVPASIVVIMTSSPVFIEQSWTDKPAMTDRHITRHVYTVTHEAGASTVHARWEIRGY